MRAHPLVHVIQRGEIGSTDACSGELRSEALEPRDHLEQVHRFRLCERHNASPPVLGDLDEAFYFQEGHADRFQQAAYGELKVTPGGDSVLVGLRDKNLDSLGGPEPIRFRP